MAELAMLADIQRMVYAEEVTRQLHVMRRDDWSNFKVTEVKCRQSESIYSVS